MNVLNVGFDYCIESFTKKCMIKNMFEPNVEESRIR